MRGGELKDYPTKCRKNLITVYLPEPDRVRLDALAKAGGISRSALFRRLLSRLVEVTPSALVVR